MDLKNTEVEGWRDIDQPVKPDLIEKVLSKIIEYENTDVIVHIGKHYFKCQMIVLQSYSVFFENKSFEYVITLPEAQVTPESFIVIYDWMLSDDPKIEREGILNLYKAARFLQIEELINQIWSCFEDKRLSENAAVTLALEARDLGLHDLKKLFMDRIAKCFLTLVASTEFEKFSVGDVCLLLGSSYLGVNSETEIFLSAIKWLSYDWNERKEYVMDLMDCVRFGLMPPCELVGLNTVEGNHPEEVKRVIEIPSVRKHIEKGLRISVLKSGNNSNFEHLTKSLENLDLIDPIKRHCLNNENMKSTRDETPVLSYQAFLNYLDVILSKGVYYWKSLKFLDDDN